MYIGFVWINDSDDDDDDDDDDDFYKNIYVSAVNVSTVEDATAPRQTAQVATAQMTLQGAPPAQERKAPRLVQPPAPVHEAQIGGTAK